jgi:hypothetical protein
MLIAWGHFAQALALLPHLSHVPIPQKTVAQTPAARLLTLLLGLRLCQISAHASSLRKSWVLQPGLSRC